jgi:hypothetical protein
MAIDRGQFSLIAQVVDVIKGRWDGTSWMEVGRSLTMG